MSQTNSKDGKNRQKNFNLILTAVVGQVGCLTTIIVVGSLLVGLFIDSRFGTRPTFTILLVVLSVPVTLGAMFWIVRKATARMKPDLEKNTQTLQEEKIRGTSE